MSTALAGVAISPVNMVDRKALGIKAGDTVRVHQKIQDKGKTRIQVFEGIVLSRKHGDEPGATFTVRKVASGVGVEKIYPLYSPNIDKIEIVRRAKVRRAKLYYIREKVAREIKRQMRRMSFVNLASESEAEAAQRKAEEEAKAAEEAEKKAAEEKAEEVKEEESAAAEAAKTEEAKVEEETTEEVTEETPGAEEKAGESETTEEPAEEKAEEVKEEESAEEKEEEKKS
ncbi:MAG: 50S ribosomal protein L19 [Patescibacteria group bacterium]